MTMEPARPFYEYFKEQCDTDPVFRVGYLKEAIDAYLAGEMAVTQIALRNFVKATLGFEELGRRLDMQSASLKRMLSPKGNPTSSNLSAIIRELQTNEGIVLSVTDERPKPTKKQRQPEPA